MKARQTQNKILGVSKNHTFGLPHAIKAAWCKNITYFQCLGKW